MADIFLDGLALQYYRGIGRTVQNIGPFSSFNFFIGPNNSGKSTVLNYLSTYMSTEKTPNIPTVDQHRGSSTGETRAAVGIARDRASTEIAASRIELKKEIVDGILDLISTDGIIWLSRVEQRRYDLSRAPSFDEFRSIFDESTWYNIWRSLTKNSGGSIRQHWIPESISLLVGAFRPNLPEVFLIPGIRQIGSRGTSFGYDGGGLIDKLAEIQSPDYDSRHDRLIFDKINNFLQTVTGNSEAQIEIPHNRDHVIVHMDNKVLPLSSLGMGIHEVVMIAAFCTILDSKMVCIEEPEIHLHPILQRKLVSYLRNNTNNQYFIATHSAAFIDTEGAAIFRVKNDGVETSITKAVLRRERYELCSELGYRASDILQANAVIWVEGPSDRLYLRHWLSALAADLVEGIHFSIMFYGGRLLSHLSASDEEVGEFIALRSLNRNSAIVMDSDKSSARGSINDTKSRIRGEFLIDGEEFCWVTQGREIENYIDFGTLQAAVAQVYGEDYDRPVSGGAYDHALHFFRKGSRRRRGGAAPTTNDPLLVTKVDKVSVAKIVASGDADFSVLDLKKRVEGLIGIVRRANR